MTSSFDGISGGTSDSERSGLSDIEIHDFIFIEVSTVVRQMTPYMFGSIKTKLIVMVDDRYVVTDVAATTTIVIVTAAFGQQRACMVTYRECYTIHPLDFNGGKDLIFIMRWITDVDSDFSTILCPNELKVNFLLNLLNQGEKDWWGLVSKTLSYAKHEAINYEHFTNMFKAEYVLNVKTKHLD